MKADNWAWWPHQSSTLVCLQAPSLHVLLSSSLLSVSYISSFHPNVLLHFPTQISFSSYEISISSYQYLILTMLQFSLHIFLENHDAPSHLSHIKLPNYFLIKFPHLIMTSIQRPPAHCAHSLFHVHTSHTPCTPLNNLTHTLLAHPAHTHTHTHTPNSHTSLTPHRH